MSFSCPDVFLEGMLTLAQEFGYDGTEPRVGGNHSHGVELDIGVVDRKRVLEAARARGIAIACIAVGSRFADSAGTASSLAEADAGIRLARDLESGIVRVFGGKLAERGARGEAIKSVAESLRSLAPLARDCGVTVCLETHDDWCDPTHVAAVMEDVNDPRASV